MSRSAIVVGAGIAGLSTAWALNRRGFDVTVIEQGPIPNPRASSYDEHRITRYAYGPWEGYAYMMPAAFAMYDRLFADIGARHLSPSPVVYFERGDSDWYEPVKRNLAEMGRWARDIPLADVPDRFPMINTEGLTRAVETEGGGVLFPIRILTDLVVRLGNLGVRLIPDTEVTSVDPDGGVVVAGEREFRADHVVIAAGAWVNRLTDAVADRVVASRQAVMFLAPPPELASVWAEMPVLCDLGTESGTYTLPPRPGTRLKVGDHVFTRRGDATGDRIASEDDLARLMRAAPLAYNDFDRYQILEKKVCFYTVTIDPSEEFQVRPWGSRAWIQSACSGHGFKLGPLIGDSVAAAIAGERDPAETTRWAAGRMTKPECEAFLTPMTEAAAQ
ncbi:FAD-dependent oxidoreductase [Acuticoccus sediminis]|uniref:FAD-dependent oxidoreductase n=1 Tax=Acuticoccus sediminis TaxID=2184697 RepID=A0A8B2NSV5_9HYPH|nr:FAD-binding oxidoreductase [Acuticoccus sediminis]RAI00192.1 FAD-dependent oxidoreductase [Acuticoccus sediminis]